MTIDLRRFRPLLILLALSFPALSLFLILKGESSEAGRAGGASAEASPAVPAQIADPTSVTRSQSLFRERNLRRAVDALRAEIPPRQKLLKVEVRGFVVEFHLRDGDGASGFSWLAKERRLRPIGVRIVGDGPLDAEQFPLEQVRAGVPGRLEARVRDEGAALTTESVTLERVAPDGYLQWTVTAAEPGDRALLFATDPRGGGFAQIDAFARRRLGE